MSSEVLSIIAFFSSSFVFSILTEYNCENEESDEYEESDSIDRDHKGSRRKDNVKSSNQRAIHKRVRLRNRELKVFVLEEDRGIIRTNTNTSNLIQTSAILSTILPSLCKGLFKTLTKFLSINFCIDICCPLKSNKSNTFPINWIPLSQ